MRSFAVFCCRRLPWPSEEPPKAGWSWLNLGPRLVTAGIYNHTPINELKAPFANKMDPTRHDQTRGPARDTLELEDNDQRLERLSGLLTRINEDGHSLPHQNTETLLSGHATAPSTLPDPLVTSQLLARVQAFLPELMAANHALDQRIARENPSSVDIESFDGTETSYIEMNLGLGLFEQRQRQGTGNGGAVEEGKGSSDDSQTTSDDSSDDSSSTNSSSENENDDASSMEDDESDTRSDQNDSEEDSREDVDLIALVTGTRPMRPLPRRRRDRTRMETVISGQGSVEDSIGGGSAPDVAPSAIPGGKGAQPRIVVLSSTSADVPEDAEVSNT